MQSRATASSGIKERKHTSLLVGRDCRGPNMRCDPVVLERIFIQNMKWGFKAVANEIRKRENRSKRSKRKGAQSRGGAQRGAKHEPHKHDVADATTNADHIDQVSTEDRATVGPIDYIGFI